MRVMNKLSVGIAMAVVAFDSAPNNKKIVGLVLAIGLLSVASVGLVFSLNELKWNAGPTQRYHAGSQ